MSNLENTKDILKIFQNARNRYYQILFFLILCVIITAIFGFIEKSPRTWICLGFMILSGIFFICFKNKQEENVSNTDEQLKKVEAYTKLHREIGDTEKTNEVFSGFFPEAGEGFTNGRLTVKSNETETDKIL